MTPLSQMAGIQPFHSLWKRGVSLHRWFLPNHPPYRCRCPLTTRPRGAPSVVARAAPGATVKLTGGHGEAWDVLAGDREIDATRVAVHGHSRLGKAALWASAQDERFALVISNNSGEGGAAIMRRNFGETTAVITKAFPHWFTKTYTSYAGNEAACPIDKHMLISLAAPRAIYIASAVQDEWADPKGEFLSGLHAEPAFAR